MPYTQAKPTEPLCPALTKTIEYYMEIQNT